MTSGREMTPPPSFSTLTHIPGLNANELPPITVSTFTSATPKNTPLTRRASTSTNPDPMISLAFVEANYQALESLLRERRKQIHNKDLHTEFDYFSEEYDEEMEMEPRPARIRETTPVPRTGSLRARRQRERVVEFKNAPNRDGAGYTDDTLQILGLHEEQRISGFVHGLRTRSLMEFLSTDLPTTYKGLMFKKTSSWDNNKRKKNRDRFSPYCGSNHRLLSNLSKSPREILATEKVTKTFEHPRLPRSRWSRNMSKYYHFHEDHGHDTNHYRELRHQIEEAVKLGQLAHLVKGIKKERKCHALKRKSTEEPVKGLREITFPPVLSANNSSDQIIIKAQISRRQVNQVTQSRFKDPTCWLLKRTLLPLGEIPLEITIGDSPFIRTELPTSFKKRLWDLLQANANVFAWIYADMTGISRTIMVGGKPFNTEHRLNEFKHIEPVKQKKRSLAPEQNEAIHKEVEELMRERADKTLPFLKTLKKCTNGKIVQWTTEAEEAFQTMKGLIETLPTVTTLIKGEALLDTARGKLEYPELETLILALVYAARRLQRYFQAHPIQILTDKPIKQILVRPEKSGHIAKWEIELGEHDIKFRGSNTIKGQILADFLAETPLVENKDMKADKTTK
ncbi:hypothetical protein Tco_0540466 [Tanacetum coccineum]